MTIAEPAAFSAQLRERSWTLHRNAESASFIRALMAGELDRDAYAAMAAQEWFVYITLETVAEKLATDPVVSMFLDSRLTRLLGLEDDLAYLYGAQWREIISASPATATYTRRIREVASTWPDGYVAHHYVRFLGDLSGGQAIARTVARHYGLTTTQGVTSYEFPAIADPKAFKDGYRAKLDAVPWSETDKLRVIDEVLLAYDFNARMFDDLSRHLGVSADA